MPTTRSLNWLSFLVQTVAVYALMSCIGLSNVHAQSNSGKVVLFNNEARNGEKPLSGVFSAKQILTVSGHDYVVTEDVFKAIQHPVILFSSRLVDRTFTFDEEAALQDFVANGGTLIAPIVQDEELYDVFGISAYTSQYNHTTLTWNSTLRENYFKWIDEPEEWTISLGDARYDTIFRTYNYELKDAHILGSYNDDKTGVTVNQYGQGKAFIFGFNWKDVILRNQINRDFEAQRVGSNGFEPSQDALMLLIRGIINAQIPFATYKHTSPGNTTSTLMVTHDIDSGTGMDTLHYFVDSEKDRGIVATYNVTVRNFSDYHMAPYYLNRYEQLSYILKSGHVIASHSVGHLPDFGNDSVFEVGHKGTHANEYHPFFDGEHTHNGTIYGECEVSKNVLEQDFGITVRAFRPGHLAYPSALSTVLNDLGYEYNSGYTATDVMTNFPYRLRENRSFNGKVTNVYEIPLTFSDVFKDGGFTQQNAISRAKLWLSIFEKMNQNGSPSTLLIHPNRRYKLKAQEYFLKKLPSRINIQEMTAYGDYWKARGRFKFDTEVRQDSITLIAHCTDESEDANVSLVISNGTQVSHIEVVDQWKQPLPFTASLFNQTDLIVVFGSNAGQVDNDGNLIVGTDITDAHTVTYSQMITPSQWRVYDLLGKLLLETNRIEDIKSLQGPEIVLVQGWHSGQVVTSELRSNRH